MLDALSHAEIADIYRKATTDGPGSLTDGEWSRLSPQDQVLLANFWDRELRQLAAHVSQLEAVAASLLREPGEEG